MQETANKPKLNVPSFLSDWARGASVAELCERHRLTDGQLDRLVGKLKQQGHLTADHESRRSGNLKIRFGSPDVQPNQATYRKAEVELDTGLVLHCPSCGAAVKRGAEQCEYCEAHLDFSLKGKTTYCPHCLAETPADGRFCMRCARQIKGLVQEGKLLEDRLCPRCNVPMRGKTYGEFAVVQCDPCNGVFVPHDTFEMMQEKRDDAVFTVDATQRRQLDASASVAYVRCPICRTVMNRQNFARISGVIVDTCRGHGIWFDPCELATIMEFIAKGGIAKAREHQRRVEKDEAAIERLRSTPAGGGLSSPAGYGRGYDTGGGIGSSWSNVAIAALVGSLFWD